MITVMLDPAYHAELLKILLDNGGEMTARDVATEFLGLHPGIARRSLVEADVHHLFLKGFLRMRHRSEEGAMTGITTYSINDKGRAEIGGGTTRTLWDHVLDEDPT